MNYSDLIWYASYGSNLSMERFMCYIEGGKPKGSQKTNEGCRDKCPPKDNDKLMIRHELYFAKTSSSWANGGVGFISTDSSEKEETFGRMYLITCEQFIDVLRQETDSKETLNVNFEDVIRKGSCVVKRDLWYGQQIYLGTRGGYPIFTFTNEENLKPYSKPSSNYLTVISQGLKEAYSMNKEEVVGYFLSRNGIKDNYSSEELLTVL